MSSTTDSAPFDYVDEDGASVIALRRRKREENEDEKTKKKLARLISDLTWSMDQPSSTNLFENHNPSNSHYEVRQIQQQFTIEAPLSPPAHKQKTAYGTKNIFLIVSTIFPNSRSSLRSYFLRNPRCRRTINGHCHDFNYIYHWHLYFVICCLSNMLYGLCSTNLWFNIIGWVREWWIDLWRNEK